MSFAAPKQLVSPPPGSIPGGDAATMLWETGEDESLARQDTWLLSFIDILALLLTLFVLLLAYQDQEQEQSSSDSEPATSLVIPFDFSLFAPHSGAGLLPLDDTTGYAMNVDTEGAVARETSSGSTEAVVAVAVAPEEDRLPVETQIDVVPDETEPVNQDTVVPEHAMVADAQEHTVPLPELEGPPLPSPAEVIQQAFAQSHLLQSVDVLSRPGAVSVEISDNILFKLASAALSPAGQQLLNEVAAVLTELPYPLSVEGHTDNVPISSSRFPSNWELSSARAAMATRALIEQGIAADRLRAIGYGDTRPRANNDTTEGRAINRRVSFVLQVDEAGQ